MSVTHGFLSRIAQTSALSFDTVRALGTPGTAPLELSGPGGLEVELEAAAAPPAPHAVPALDRVSTPERAAPGPARHPTARLEPERSDERLARPVDTHRHAPEPAVTQDAPASPFSAPRRESRAEANPEQPTAPARTAPTDATPTLEATIAPRDAVVTTAFALPGPRGARTIEAPWPLARAPQIEFGPAPARRAAVAEPAVRGSAGHPAPGNSGLFAANRDARALPGDSQPAPSDPERSVRVQRREGVESAPPEQARPTPRERRARAETSDGATPSVLAALDAARGPGADAARASPAGLVVERLEITVAEPAMPPVPAPPPLVRPDAPSPWPALDRAFLSRL